jgi:hypothetical protein
MLNQSETKPPEILDSNSSFVGISPKQNQLKSALSLKKSNDSDKNLHPSGGSNHHDSEHKVKVKFREELSRNNMGVNTISKSIAKDSVTTSVDIPSLKVIFNF